MLLDSSGNNYNLTNNGATFDVNNYVKGNGSVSFNHANQAFLRIPPINLFSIQSINGISFSLWFRMNTTNTGNYPRIFDFNNGISPTASKWILISRHSTNNKLNFDINNTANPSGNKITTNDYIDGNWHHIVWTINNVGRWDIYIDGAVASFTTALPTNVNIENITFSDNYFGKSGVSGDGFLSGNIDDFRIYNSVLTSSNVSELYRGRIEIYSKSAIGIGTSKNLNSNLTIDGSSYISGIASFSNSIFQSNATTPNVLMGNVGIGTTNTNTYKLNVNGFLNASNFTGDASLLNNIRLENQSNYIYPPQSLSSSPSTISNSLYANGIYNITASSFASGKEAFRCFNGSSTDDWTPSTASYSGGTGAYKSSPDFTTNINGSNINGEWIQIQYDKGFAISSFTITGISASNANCPSNFTLAGSFNSSNWVLLSTQTNIGDYTTTPTKTFSIYNFTAYNFYRLIITKTVSATTLSIAEISFRGTQNTSFTNLDTFNIIAYNTNEKQFPPYAWSSVSSETQVSNEIFNCVPTNVYKETITLSNGQIYTLYSSSTYGSLFKSILFNFINSEEGAHWQPNNYTPNNGTNNTNFYISESNYNGDWIIIRLPIRIILTRFTFIQRPGVESRAPSLWKCYGSNDGVNFTEIIDASNTTTAATYTSGATTRTLPSIFDIPYQFIGWTINKLVGGNANAAILNFTELQIFGKDDIANSYLNVWNKAGLNIFNTLGNVGIGTTDPGTNRLSVNGNINCEGGIAINGSDAFFYQGNSVLSSEKTNTYLNFKAAGSTNDWLYLRQIGGNNSYKLAFDFHDDLDDARFCLRSVGSAGTDAIREYFTVENQNVTISGDNPTLTIKGNEELQTSIIYLSTPVNSTSALKTAIISEGISSWSRSKLHFCLNNTPTGSAGSTDWNANPTYNATVADARMTILPNGNVGIANTNPGNIFQIGAGDRLKISNGNSDFTLIGTSDTGGVNNTAIVLSGSSRSVQAGNIEHIAVNNHIFYTTSTGSYVERMRISSTGNVGIGTNTNINSRLTIKSNYNDINSGICLDANDGETYNLKIAPYVIADANVGYKFQIVNRSTTVDTLTIDKDYAYIRGLRIAGSDTGNTIWQNTGNLGISANTGNNITFSIGNGIERMRISSTGNIGIGTNNPNATLELYSTTQLSSRIILSGKEFYQNSAIVSGGIALLCGVNRTGNRQLWIGDSENLTQNTTNRIMRISTDGIDAIATDGTTGLSMYIGNSSSITTIRGSSITMDNLITLPNNIWSVRTADLIDRIYFASSGTTFFHSGNTNGNGFIFRNTAQSVDILTLADNGNLIASANIRGNTLIAGDASYQLLINGPTASAAATIQTIQQSVGYNQNLTLQATAGNVGIGTNNPGTRLHIEHSSTSSLGSSGGLYLFNPNNTANSSSILAARIGGSTANKAGVSLDVNGHYGWSMHINGNDTTNRLLRFNASWDGSGTDRLTINYNGNINVSGNIINQYWRLANDSDYLRLYNSAGTEYFNFAAKHLWAETTLNVGTTANIVGGTTIGGQLTLSTANNPLFISSGTTNANNAINIRNNANYNAFIGVGGTNFGGYYQNNLFIESASGAIIFNTNGRVSSDTPNMMIDTLGNVGIGINPGTNNKLSVSGNINCEGGIAITGSDAFDSIDSVLSTERTNTYLNLKYAGSANDWCYLRQIGGNNSYKLAFDMHDDTLFYLVIIFMVQIKEIF